jgi:hypothetical protein
MMLSARVGPARLLGLLCVLSLAVPAHAHVGNKDVFEQVDAGPYKLFVTIRTPTVIPGVATVEVRAADSPAARVSSIRITPIPLIGEASLHPPTADPMRASADDPAFFMGSLWLMAPGSWQVRLEVEGSAGSATTGVPVAAVPLSVLSMQRPLGITLTLLGLVLALGMASIVAAAVRESRLAPGAAPTPERSRRADIAGRVALAFAAVSIVLGGWWWKVDDTAYARDIYRPSNLRVGLTGDTLDVAVGSYRVKLGQWKADPTDQLLVDHDHVMHLYAIRWPQMDAAFHLHPVPVTEKHLTLALPAMPPGTYKLYADVVHRNGFPETLTTTLIVPPGLTPVPLASDDAEAHPAPLEDGGLGPVYKLPDGYTLVWDRPAAISANTGYLFRFHLLDPAGRPATEMQPYLGMAGHAAFVKTDGSTFAHTHPDGSAAMPAMMLANPQAAGGTAGGMRGMPGMDGMPGMEDMEPSAARVISPTVAFPYGFPSPGRYRIFIQMKHAGIVETGVFDAEVH